MSIAATIKSLFAQRGQSEYGGEVVTQLDHALQCATLAEESNAAPSLVVAALLHDVGHLLHDLPDDAPDRGVDDRHEHQGYRFLCERFPEAVSQPVRMHVDAKRYLCTVDDNYLASLSEPSLVSFRLQGGKMSEDELTAFRAKPHWEASLELRRWDDAAKVDGLKTPDLAHFLSLVDHVAKNSP